MCAFRVYDGSWLEKEKMTSRGRRRQRHCTLMSVVLILQQFPGIQLSKTRFLSYVDMFWRSVFGNKFTHKADMCWLMRLFKTLNCLRSALSFRCSIFWRKVFRFARSMIYNLTHYSLQNRQILVISCMNTKNRDLWQRHPNQLTVWQRSTNSSTRVIQKS